MEQKVLDAYALGYYYGRAEGILYISDASYTEEQRIAYVRGYDRGVSDYCDEFEAREEV